MRQGIACAAAVGTSGKGGEADRHQFILVARRFFIGLIKLNTTSRRTHRARVLLNCTEMVNGLLLLSPPFV